jgi:hypothetical protein
LRWPALPQCVSDAIAVAPNSEATTSAEIARLDRMGLLLIQISDAGAKTCKPNECSLTDPGFSARPMSTVPPWASGMRGAAAGTCAKFGPTSAPADAYGASLLPDLLFEDRFRVIGYLYAGEEIEIARRTQRA